MSSGGNSPRAEDNDVVENMNTDRPPRRHGGSISSFLLISFLLFMLTNNRGDESLTRYHYQEALDLSTHQLSNYSAWLNGSTSSFSLVRSIFCI